MINIAIESEAEESKNEKKTTAKGGHSFVIPVVEEQAQIGKQVVESGRVRISKNVQEQEELVNLTLTHEEHRVERVPVNEYVETPPPPVRYEGDTMIIPVLREVVQVRLLVVEELHITNKQVQTQVNQPVTLLKEEVNVERQTNEPSDNQPA